MNISIINLPGYDSSKNNFYIKAGSRWSFRVEPTPKPEDRLMYCPYPFMLSYTAQILKRETEHDVNLIDGVAEKLTWQKMLGFLELKPPDILITELVTVSYNDDIQFLNLAKKKFHCQIYVGGPHATVMWNEILQNEHCIDYILIGEYENTVKELITGNKNDQILGIAYRNNNKPVQNERRPPVDINTFPFADRDSLKNTYYRDFCFQEPLAIVMATRGCPMNCDFCIERHIMYNNNKYRMRQVGNVVNEMKMLTEKYGVKQVYFDDMTFTVSKRFINELCDELCKCNLKIKWSCMGDLFSSINYATLKNMRKAGCVGMKFGIETIDEDLIKGIGKNLNINSVKEKIGWLHKLGIFSHATIMFGLPGDSIESMKKTIDFAYEMDIDSVQYSIATPFPGTPFFAQAEKKGWLKEYTWENYSGHGHCVLQYPEIKKEEVEKIYNKMVQMGSGRAWGGNKRIRMKILKNLNPINLSLELKKLIYVFGFMGMIRILIKGFRRLLVSENTNMETIL